MSKAREWLIELQDRISSGGIMVGDLWDALRYLLEKEAQREEAEEKHGTIAVIHRCTACGHVVDGEGCLRCKPTVEAGGEKEPPAWLKPSPEFDPNDCGGPEDPGYLM